MRVCIGVAGQWGVGGDARVQRCEGCGADMEGVLSIESPAVRLQEILTVLHVSTVSSASERVNTN